MRKILPFNVCRKTGCENVAVYHKQKTHLCVQHLRFTRMRTTALRHKKYKPTFAELEKLAASLEENDMACPDCGVKMNWLAEEGRSTNISLQHYRDGSIGLVCASCNTRHAFMPGDSYRTRNEDEKFCHKCLKLKPISEFYKANNKSLRKLYSNCKACNGAANSLWHKVNRDKYNERRRHFRQRKKLENENAV